MTTAPIPWIDLRRQYESIKDEVDGAVRRVMDSGRYVMGPEADAFEREWAAYCGAEYAVALGSGTASINLTLKALGIGPGDEVITGAFTVSAPIDAIQDTGATPVLVDMDDETLTLSASHVAAKVTDRTKAIVAVHVYGHPADIDALIAIAEPRGIPVVLDGCEGHGAYYKGKQASSLATISCFSFYPTKNLGAIGDAGGIVTNDAGLAARIRLVRHHGWDKRYHSALPSLNSRMDEIQAAVLRAKLAHLEAWNNRRREIAARYDAALRGSEVQAAAHAEWADPCYFLYVVRTKQRDALKSALAEAGIATDVSWPEPPHLQPAYEYLGYGRGSLPVTERLCNEVLTLPMFPELTDHEVERVAAALHDFAISHATTSA